MSWETWCMAADEWVAAYVSIEYRHSAPKLFAPAHAFELYLKAWSLKTNPNFNVGAQRHNLWPMWLALLQDQGFTAVAPNVPAELQVAPPLPIDAASMRAVVGDEWCEIFVALTHVVDLKYGFTPWPKPPASRNSYTLGINGTWLLIFRAVRISLGWDGRPLSYPFTMFDDWTETLVREPTRRYADVVVTRPGAHFQTPSMIFRLQRWWTRRALVLGMKIFLWGHFPFSNTPKPLGFVQHAIYALRLTRSYLTRKSGLLALSQSRYVKH